jgi:hypothetical protein
MGERFSSGVQRAIERKVDRAEQHDRTHNPGGSPINDFIFFHISLTRRRPVNARICDKRLGRPPSRAMARPRCQDVRDSASKPRRSVARSREPRPTGTSAYLEKHSDVLARDAKSHHAHWPVTSDRLTIGAISENSQFKTSRRINTARSVGVNVSSRTRNASESESAN